jgi:hypothetical protein
MDKNDPGRPPTATRAMNSNSKLPFPSEPDAVEAPEDRPPATKPANGATLPAETTVSRNAFPRGHVWLRRAGVLLFVFLCATLGVMLMILPWRPEWSDNSLLLSYPAIRELISTGFIRGVVTGLGLLNVWIGFWEAIQYRED